MDALGPESRREEAADGTLLALEWRAAAAVPAGKVATTAPARDESVLPDWVHRPAPAPPAAERRLAPSAAVRLDDEGEPLPELAVARQGEARAAALARGRLVHRLLQSLPDHPPETRREVGARYLAAIAPTADAAILDEIMAVLDDPAFAPLFSAESRAEVEIAGRVALAVDSVAVSGRIDRLAVTPDRVFIVDYKTNRPAPRRLEDVPPGYVAQLALYRRVLARLYPDRPVAAALLWTDIPALMEVPSRMLDEAESAMIGG
jgi:ATP-dependent helicase/nuclease subunit A